LEYFIYALIEMASMVKNSETCGLHDLVRQKSI